MALTRYVPNPDFAEYSDRFREHFQMERRNGIILLRMHTLGNDRMPPIGSQVVDTDGTAAVDAWIDNLKVCLDTQSPSIDVTFDTDSIVSGDTSTITFTLTNPNAVGLTGASFTNAFRLG